MRLVFYVRTEQLETLRGNLSAVTKAIASDPRRPVSITDSSQIFRVLLRTRIVNSETIRGQVENSGKLNDKKVDLDKMDEAIQAAAASAKEPPASRKAPSARGWSKVVLDLTTSTWDALRKTYGTGAYLARATGAKSFPSFADWLDEGIRSGVLELYQQVRLEALDSGISV